MTLVNPHTTAEGQGMPPSGCRVVIVSAVRNEEKYLGQMLDTLVGQTVRPLKLAIVDDGSTDGTLALAQSYADGHRWIEVVARVDRGCRQSGIGVVEAFYDGYALVATLEFDYIVKLDGDVVLPERYFEQLIGEFERDPKLGICSGDIYNREAGRLILDSPDDPGFHVRGAAKVYRRACWEAIGGIQRVTGFDCVDNVKARMLGWDTRRLARPEVIHLRRTGHANGTWRNSFKDGVGANAIGYHPLFLLLKCLKRLGRANPVGAAGQFCGFIAAYFKDVPRIHDKELKRYLRQQQMNRLLGRETIWR